MGLEKCSHVVVGELSSGFRGFLNLASLRAIHLPWKVFTALLPRQLFVSLAGPFGALVSKGLGLEIPAFK